MAERSIRETEANHSKLRLVVGRIWYARTQHYFQVGYTDGEWVWVVKVDLNPVLKKFENIRKYIPKNRLTLIGKVKLGTCTDVADKHPIDNQLKSMYPPFITLEEAKEMKMHNHFRGAKYFSAYADEDCNGKYI